MLCTICLYQFRMCMSIRGGLCQDHVCRYSTCKREKKQSSIYCKVHECDVESCINGKKVESCAMVSNKCTFHSQRTIY